MITTLVNVCFKTDNGKRYSKSKIGRWVAAGIALRILWQMSQLRVQIHSIKWTATRSFDQLQSGDIIKFRLTYRIENPSFIGTPAVVRVKCIPLSHDAATFGKTASQFRLAWLPGGNYLIEGNFKIKAPRFIGSYQIASGLNGHYTPLRTIWLFGQLLNDQPLAIK